MPWRPLAYPANQQQWQQQRWPWQAPWRVSRLGPPPLLRCLQRCPDARLWAGRQSLAAWRSPSLAADTTAHRSLLICPFRHITREFLVLPLAIGLHSSYAITEQRANHEGVRVPRTKSTTNSSKRGGGRMRMLASANCTTGSTRCRIISAALPRIFKTMVQ